MPNILVLLLADENAVLRPDMYWRSVPSAETQPARTQASEGLDHGLDIIP